jgi:acyl-coenzyme A synthetase/AMP-(fatty) acid ligase
MNFPPSPNFALADGRARIGAPDIAAAVAAIDRFLGADAEADLPVSLECDNSISGVLTLLALLARGVTVVLLPAGASVAPQFVARRIRTRVGVPFDPQDPQRSLDITFTAGSQPPRPLPPDSPLRRGHVLVRTSGSLGAPKLVVHTHAGLLANARNAVERLGLTTADRVLIPVSVAHMYGLGAALLPALFAGAAVELLEGANLVRYLERERASLPTVAFLTPNLCGMLRRPRAAAAHYRQVVVAGDKLGAEAFAACQALYRRVVALYGSSELGVIAAADGSEAAGLRATTVGRALPGVQLRLAAPADDTAGELHCKHPFGFVGYVDERGEPVVGETDVGDGWTATRDLVRIHPGGELEVLGRCDHAVKRDGRLVMLGDVEQALARLAGVGRAAAVVAGETLRGRGIVAFVAPHNDMDHVGLDPDALRRAMRDVLPAYAVPDDLRVVPALPLLPGGKLDRKTLQTLAHPQRPDQALDHGHSQTPA